MLLAILIYFGMLLLLQRAVGSVLHPVLFAGGIWIIASPITTHRLTASPLISIRGVLMAGLMPLFCFREAAGSSPLKLIPGSTAHSIRKICT